MACHSPPLHPLSTSNHATASRRLTATFCWLVAQKIRPVLSFMNYACVVCLAIYQHILITPIRLSEWVFQPRFNWYIWCTSDQTDQTLHTHFNNCLKSLHVKQQADPLKFCSLQENVPSLQTASYFYLNPAVQKILADILFLCTSTTFPNLNLRDKKIVSILTLDLIQWLLYHLFYTHSPWTEGNFSAKAQITQHSARIQQSRAAKNPRCWRSTDNTWAQWLLNVNANWAKEWNFSFSSQGPD